MNDFCIRLDNDESHFNILLHVTAKVTKTVSTNPSFFRERRAEAESI